MSSELTEEEELEMLLELDDWTDKWMVDGADYNRLYAFLFIRAIEIRIIYGSPNHISNMYAMKDDVEKYYLETLKMRQNHGKDQSK
jgi:hypothetical protein